MTGTPKPKDKFSRYTDATGQFSNRDLKTGEWYVQNKILLRNILIGVLGVWSVISVGYSLVAWGSYIVDGYFDDRALARRSVTQFQNYTGIQSTYGAKPLSFNTLQVYSTSEGLYDFVSLAQNKNERFVIRLHYVFTYDGGQTSEHDTLILPMATSPVAALGQALENYPSNPTLKIQKITYERISAHKITQIKQYIEQRTKFSVDNLEFIPPQEGVPTSRIKFDLINETTHEFWEPFFYIEPLSGGTAVGILSNTLTDFQPGERRVIEMATFLDVSGADDIRLTPVMDVFDQSIYKKP